jgi:hypothetical protein
MAPAKAEANKIPKCTRRAAQQQNYSDGDVHIWKLLANSKESSFCTDKYLAVFAGLSCPSSRCMAGALTGFLRSRLQ